MKKYFASIVLILLSATFLKAQESILFKIKMLPDHIYSSDMKMSMNMMMTAPLTGKKSTTKPKPAMDMKMESASVNINETGSARSDGSFPFTMTMKKLSAKMIMNGKETDMPGKQAEQKFYGVCTRGGKLNIDSIPGIKVTDSVKKAMLQTIKKAILNVDFPARKLKVGDTFTLKTPLDLPIMGASAKMMSVRNYKLVSIQNDKAYFNVAYTIAMDMNMKKGNMDMQGSGTEKLIYDINKNFAVGQQENMKIVYYVTMPQGKMKGTMNMIMSQTTTIK